nr:unnamed protein product [Callosobruchus analis]
MNILQINFDRGREAQDLLNAMAKELQAAVLAVAEPNKAMGKFGAALQQIQRDRILTADDLIEELTIVCNRAMPPRIRTNRKTPVYWWSQEIAQSRRECLKARRAYTKRNLQAHVREIRRDRILTADDLIEELTIVCNRAMPPRIRTNRKTPVYWWSQEIAQSRRECLKARRAYTKRNLQAHVREIRRAQSDYKVSWTQICSDVARSNSYSFLTQARRKYYMHLTQRISGRTCIAQTIPKEFLICISPTYSTATPVGLKF